MRVGIHCGGLAAGVLGVKFPRYAFFGGTPQLAAALQVRCIFSFAPCKRFVGVCLGGKRMSSVLHLVRCAVDLNVVVCLRAAF